MDRKPEDTVASQAAALRLTGDEEVVLFDLPSLHKGDGTVSSFSFNVWKSRMVLNYKKIPYKTEWSEYPDLGPKLKALGVAPNATGRYTCPTIRLLQSPEEEAFVQDSLDIAKKLETLFPQPSLHLDAELHGPMTDAVENLLMAIGPDALFAVVDNTCLSESSRAYFRETRKQMFGISLDDLKAQKGGEACWEVAEAPGGALNRFMDLLTKHKRDYGPFALGSQVSYADFVAAGWFENAVRLDLNLYVRMMNFHESFGQVHQACRPWLQRDD